MVYEIVKAEYIAKGGKMVNVTSSEKKRKMSSQEFLIDNYSPDYSFDSEVQDPENEVKDIEIEDENENENENENFQDQDYAEEEEQTFEETFKDQERLVYNFKELSDANKTILKLFSESQNFYNIVKTNENFFFYLELYKYIVNFFKELKVSNKKVKNYGRISEKMIADAVIFYYSNLDNSQLKLRREFTSTKSSKENNTEAFKKIIGVISKYPNMTTNEFVETEPEILFNLRVINTVENNILSLIHI